MPSLLCIICILPPCRVRTRTVSLMEPSPAWLKGRRRNEYQVNGTKPPTRNGDESGTLTPALLMLMVFSESTRLVMRSITVSSTMDLATKTNRKG